MFWSPVIYFKSTLFGGFRKSNVNTILNILKPLKPLDNLSVQLLAGYFFTPSRVLWTLLGQLSLSVDFAKLYLHTAPRSGARWQCPGPAASPNFFWFHWHSSRAVPSVG